MSPPESRPTEHLHAVQAANVADRAVAVGLIDGAAQASELVGLAEHRAPVVFLLAGIDPYLPDSSEGRFRAKPYSTESLSRGEVGASDCNA